MKKATYHEFNRFTTADGDYYFYFATEEGYEYEKEGIKFYFRKQNDVWNITIQLGYQIRRCRTIQDAIDYIETLDIQNVVLPLMKKGESFIKTHQKDIVDESEIEEMKKKEKGFYD